LPQACSRTEHRVKPNMMEDQINDVADYCSDTYVVVTSISCAKSCSHSPFYPDNVKLQEVVLNFRINAWFKKLSGKFSGLDLGMNECTKLHVLQTSLQLEAPYVDKELTRTNHGRKSYITNHAKHSQRQLGTTNYANLLHFPNISKNAEVKEREQSKNRNRHVRRRQQWPSWQRTRHLQIFNRGTPSTCQVDNPMTETLVKLLQLMGGIEPNPGPMYHDKQDRSYCLVHAINNALGRQILTGQELCIFLSSLQTIRPDILEHYHIHEGDFTDTALNIWLWSHLTIPQMISRRQMERQKATNRAWTLEAIEHVLDNKWDSALIQHHDHCTAIKKHQGSWYLLDSLKEAPMRLDETNCHQVQGALLTIEVIDAQEHGLLEHPTREQPYVTSYTQIPDSMTPYHKDKFLPQQYPVRYLPKHRDIPVVRPYPPNRIHHEKQESLFCAIHALNALFGRAITNGRDVCKYMDKLKTQHAAFANLYTTKQGNFATGAINLWLRAHTSPKVALVTITDAANEVDERNWTLDKMKKTMGCKWDRVMVVNPMVHWITIRKAGKEYLLVDSMQNTVLNLTTNPEHWAKVKGIPVALQARDTMSYQDAWYGCTTAWLAANPPTAGDKPIHPHAITIDTTVSLPLPPSNINGMASTNRGPEADSDVEEQSPPPSPRVRHPPPRPTITNSNCRRVGTQKPAPPLRIQKKLKTKQAPYAKLRNSILRATTGNTAHNQPDDPNKHKVNKKELCKQNPITSFFARIKHQTPKGTVTRDSTPASIDIHACGTMKKTVGDLPQPPTWQGETPPNTRDTKKQEPTTSPKMTILTLNVRGIKTGQVDAWEIITKQAPDIVILTETHMHSKQKRNYYLHNECLSGYNLITSYDDELIRGSGVLIAMKTMLYKHGNIEILREYEYKGYVLPIKITLPYSETLILVGTYLPNSDTTETMNEPSRRDHAISCMQKLLDYHCCRGHECSAKAGGPSRTQPK
jgi:hypothetical protein